MSTLWHEQTAIGFWGIKPEAQPSRRAYPQSSPSDWDDDEPRVSVIYNGQLFDLAKLSKWVRGKLSFNA